MTTKTSVDIKRCGIVMPISSIDGCSAEHWSEVLEILKESIGQAEFEPLLVSDADDSGIIQKRIIHNLYSNDIVVCDVSAKNPNVMFELGMRLAFDKPTIIVKDDKTDYSFDTSIIEHLTYPRDLRFSKIVTFKEALKRKIQATYKAATSDSEYTTFLKNFGEYKVAHLAEKEVSSDKFILNAIEDLRSEMKLMRRNDNSNNNIHSTAYSKQFIREMVKEYFDRSEYIIEDFVLNPEKQEDIFKYISSFDESKRLFKTPRDLKRAISGYIDPF
ncbi:hypothetical protein [Carboxylicivirga sp. RSCT41]|uniref:hypothetical protein n=1 Tax=Carboxylicivirga agarovorans TaxID=3417570 RepID=UPI003D33EF97